MKYNRQSFVDRASQLYNNKYEYSQVIYNGLKQKVTIICPIHGPFVKTPNIHLYQLTGCPICSKLSKQHIKSKCSYTKQQLIEKSIAIHGDRYDYTQVHFINGVNLKQKVNIVCKIHGIFTQSFSAHIYNKHGCGMCGNQKAGENRPINTLNKRQLKFINQATIQHNGEYDYSLVKYVDCNTKIVVECKSHGQFIISPKLHLRGQRCPICTTESNDKGCKFKTFDQFVQLANQAHESEYKYERIRGNNWYIATDDPVQITCKLHGQFTQTINKHLYQKTKCPQCYQDRKPTLKLKSTKQFVSDCKLVHGDRYDYTQTVYSGSFNKVSIGCPIHGQFIIDASNHLHGAQGCNKCYQSSGEQQIDQVLRELALDFVHQYKPIGCVSPVTGKQLRFDFFIPSLNLIIEYDGIYHYQAIKHGDLQSDADARLTRHMLYDDTKTKWAADNGIELFRIPYFTKQSVRDVMFDKVAQSRRIVK